MTRLLIRLPSPATPCRVELIGARKDEVGGLNFGIRDHDGRAVCGYFRTRFAPDSSDPTPHVWLSPGEYQLDLRIIDKRLQQAFVVPPGHGGALLKIVADSWR